MKKILLCMLISVGLCANSSIPSPLPLPDKIFIDLDPESCDIECLEEFAKNEMYFTFLAKYPNIRDKSKIGSTYDEVTSIFQIKPAQLDFAYDFTKENAQVKLAVLVPKSKIKKYATTTVNSIIAYLMARNSAFDIEVFNTKDENPQSLALALQDIKSKGYKVVIAPVTTFGANFLTQNVTDLLVFIPTINSSQVANISSNILYGGIDYNQQIQKLLSIGNQKIATFSDGSGLGNRLDILVAQNAFDVAYSKQITQNKINLKYILKGNKILQNASIFLNMPLVKSSLLSSQLRSYDIYPYALLSTQISFNPMLLTLTQYEDRKNMYIANSIGEIPFDIRVTNELFKHSVKYDWVNYATNVGLDYLYTNFYASQNERVFKEQLNGNQIAYDVNLYRASRFGFNLIGE